MGRKRTALRGRPAREALEVVVTTTAGRLQGGFREASGRLQRDFI